MTPSFRTPRRAAGRYAAVAAALLLASCSADDAIDGDGAERPIHELYNIAADTLQGRDFERAAKLFDDLERQHPYSSWATKAQVMAAYAYYKADRYDEALIAIDRFIRLHPGNRDVAYAYYLRALCHYEQISDVARDQSRTERAVEALQEVARRFPDSRYARDAALKLDLARDHLAGSEMAVGRFYLRRGHYLAALNRFRRVVEAYETTTHAAEALHRMVEAYAALGLAEEARKSAAVLGHNYPGSAWYQDSYALVAEGSPRPKAERGFFERIFGWLF